MKKLLIGVLPASLPGLIIKPNPILLQMQQLPPPLMWASNTRSVMITSATSFIADRSWGLHKTDYILSHEQGHFDLAELFARKLHKEMSNYTFNKKSFQKDLKKIYDSIMKERESTQNQYDKETNHSINKEKQAEWLKKISRMLEELKDYADY